MVGSQSVGNSSQGLIPSGCQFSPLVMCKLGQIFGLLSQCCPPLQVYACGEGTNGRLGCGGLSDISNPKLISDLSTYVVRKVAVNSGGRHAMALTADGKVFSWGDGEYGQLGHADNK